MTQETIIFFGLGIVLEVFNILRKNEGLPGKKSLWKFAFVFVFPLLSFLPGKKEVGYHFDYHLFAYFVMAAMLTIILFQEAILPVIRERTLLIFTLIFWYLQVSVFGWTVILHPVYALALGFSGVVLVNAFTGWDPPSSIKVALTVWFFAILLVTGWMTLGFPLASALNDGHVIGNWEAFMYGISFFYLMAFYFYIIQLLPIPGKHQSFTSRIQQWKEYVRLLVSKYDQAQIQIWESLMILAFAALVFGVNYFYRYVEPGLLVSGIIVFYNAVEFFESKRLALPTRKKA